MLIAFICVCLDYLGGYGFSLGCSNGCAVIPPAGARMPPGLVRLRPRV